MRDSLNRLKDVLFKSLAPAMDVHGFVLRKRPQQFEKKFPGGRFAFHVGFIRHPLDVDVTADVAVRFDDLEALVYENDKDRAADSFSLGAELGNLTEGAPIRWTLTSGADGEPVAASIIQAFRSIGLPYLLRYSSAQEALAALSGDDRRAWLHSPVHGERAKRALGLAFLLKDYGLLETLADAKTAFLRGRNDPTIQDFLDFRRTIEARVASASV